MRYEEFRPVEPLATFVKCFWVLESPAPHSAGPERILPDGCTEIVFHLGDPFDQHHSDGTTERQPLALLVGQMRRHLLIRPTGRVRVLGVRFWPGGAYPFLTLPQNEIAGRVIALDSIWGAITSELHSRIADAATPAESVAHIEATLLARLNNFRRHDNGVLRAIGLILRSGGHVPVESLAVNMGVSLRRLDRTFNTRVGLPPKTLCRIVRFQRVFKMLEQKENGRDWVQIALDCGYYDQAHFVKEFKEFAGKAPTSYFAEQNAMSELFTGAS
ncbi:MAG TPA: helix-turn-helix domain-containing protein [Blastocatellia bacterium]|nr:helix-turn-helix domain-containing protein [Blastocatellia bacterium]